MSTLIQRLRKDHADMSRLLSLLARELWRFHDGERSDPLLIAEILSYFTGYPAECHHPVEDLIYQQLTACEAADTAALDDIEADHVGLQERAQNLQALLQRMIDGECLPRPLLVSAGSDFIARQRHHIQMEEAVFFPLAETCLTAEDWQEIDRKIDEHELSPPSLTRRYHSLCGAIIAANAREIRPRP